MERAPHESEAAEGMPDAYLTQVGLAVRVLGWPPETAAQVLLSLEGEALKVLDDLLPHELDDWETAPAKS